MATKVITNNHWRHVIFACELEPEELADFDYLDEGEGTFFRYRGNLYDLNEFTVFGTPWSPNIPDESHPFYGWDAVAGDSYFSGILIKLSDDGEAVRVARYIS